MKNHYKSIKKSVFLFLLTVIISLSFSFASIAQGEIVLQDNFDNFNHADISKYQCSEYWQKYEENGNNVAFLDQYYEGDQMGIKVSLNADSYSFGFKVKKEYGNASNLWCSWNEASSSGMGDPTRRIYDESIADSPNYSNILTSTFTVETAGDYILYIALSDEIGGAAFYIDDFVLYKGESASDCSAPINFNNEVLGSIVKLNWERPNSNEIFNEEFEGIFPPEDWSRIITNTYEESVTWHKFDKVEGNTPIPYEGNGCASIFWDIDPQDEWLIFPVEQGSKYLDFWFWMSEYILELKQQQDFSDHYYVKVSYDGGTTWSILWDAVESCLGTNDWERVSLNLGNVNNNTKVAFQAVSALSNGLYLNWFIDNVKISSKTNEGSGINSFNIYKNNQKIVENLTSDTYTDKDVALGTYNYCLTANYTDCESDKTCTNVLVGEVPCNKPKITHYEVKPNQNKPDTYDVHFYWDEPEYSGRDVYYYNCYLNSGMIGMWVEDAEFGQIEVTEGVYRYGVTAVYQQPDCESEEEYIDIIVGENLCLPVDKVKATVNSNTVDLTWGSRENVESYSVYRAGEEIAKNITVTKYTDNNAPQGTYDYCIIAYYDNNCVSSYELYSCATVKIGNPVLYNTPFKEEFSSEFKPKDWEVINLSATPEKNMVWRFNNPGKRVIEGSGFDRSFVILDSDYYSIGQLQNCELITPTIYCYPQFMTISVLFDMQFLSTGDDESTTSSDASLYITNNDGANWILIKKLEPEFIQDPEQEPSDAINYKFDISDLAKGKDIRLKWVYTGGYSLHLAIDNVVVDGTIGINEIENDNIKIYPNPSKGLLNISSNNCNIKEISIFETTGKLCYQSSTINNNYDLSFLSNGIYIVKILTENGTSNYKLIIEK